jgi:hypothetical protein
MELFEKRLVVSRSHVLLMLYLAKIINPFYSLSLQVDLWGEKFLVQRWCIPVQSAVSHRAWQNTFRRYMIMCAARWMDFVKETSYADPHNMPR